ncbi:hypothetical protein SAMN05192561_101604 [Halopenitus malekzadehii]|uniref:Uncharacterized protein n=1 Tax=Halopenitus malekzadehii TaxID=1267564 RepID=A0A1H6I109_9EURY|nr:hypothetical protein [Halopenitus malekzadehii]SEH40208.1 hypothetical protein SAMN05192561_101604 [Halopenitus malekzadehii]
MPELVVLVLLALLVVQIPIAAIVYLDARRLGLENPEIYWLGILIPTGGLIVIPVYLSRRRELPRESSTEGEDEEAEGEEEAGEAEDGEAEDDGFT